MRAEVIVPGVDGYFRCFLSFETPFEIRADPAYDAVIERCIKRAEFDFCERFLTPGSASKQRHEIWTRIL